MQKYVIVRKGGKVIGKEVYAGDLSVVSGRLVERKLADADLEFEEMDEAEFDGTAIEVGG